MKHGRILAGISACAVVTCAVFFQKSLLRVDEASSEKAPVTIGRMIGEADKMADPRIDSSPVSRVLLKDSLKMLDRSEVVDFFEKEASLKNRQEILDLILREYGPGRRRDEAIEDLYAVIVHKSGLENIVHLLDDLGVQSGEINDESIRQGILGGCANSKVSDLSEFGLGHMSIIKRLVVSHADAQKFAKIILPTTPANYLDDPSVNREIGLVAIKTFFSNHKFSDLILATYASSQAYSAPNEAWEILTDDSLSFSRIVESEPKLVENLLGGLFKNDPANTMEKLRNSPEVSGTMVSNIFSKWIDQDSRAAMEWFSEEEKSGAGESLDSYRLGFLDIAIRRKELIAGKEWAEEILNTDLKRESMERLKKIELDFSQN